MPVLRMYRQKINAPGLIGKRGGPNHGEAIPHNQSLAPRNILLGLFQLGMFIQAGETVNDEGG